MLSLRWHELSKGIDHFTLHLQNYTFMNYAKLLINMISDGLVQGIYSKSFVNHNRISHIPKLDQNSSHSLKISRTPKSSNSSNSFNCWSIFEFPFVLILHHLPLHLFVVLIINWSTNCNCPTLHRLWQIKNSRTRSESGWTWA